MSEQTSMISLCIVVTSQDIKEACELAEEMSTVDGAGIHLMSESLSEEAVTEFVKKLIDTARVAGLTGLIDGRGGRFIAGWLPTHQ